MLNYRDIIVPWISTGYRTTHQMRQMWCSYTSITLHIPLHPKPVIISIIKPCWKINFLLVDLLQLSQRTGSAAAGQHLQSCQGFSMSCHMTLQRGRYLLTTLCGTVACGSPWHPSCRPTASVTVINCLFRCSQITSPSFPKRCQWMPMGLSGVPVRTQSFGTL